MLNTSGNMANANSNRTQTPIFCIKLLLTGTTSVADCGPALPSLPNSPVFNTPPAIWS